MNEQKSVLTVGAWRNSLTDEQAQELKIFEGNNLVDRLVELLDACDEFAIDMLTSSDEDAD